MGSSCSTGIIKDRLPVLVSIGKSYDLTESTIDDEPHDFGIIDYDGNLSYKHGLVPTESARAIHHIADEFRDHFGKSNSPNVHIKCKDVYFLRVDDLMERKELYFKYKVGNERLGSSLVVFDNILVDLASGVDEASGKVKWINIYLQIPVFLAFIEKIAKCTKLPLNYQGVTFLEKEKLVLIRIVVNTSDPDPNFSVLEEKFYADQYDEQEVQFIESHGRKFTSLKQVKDYEIVRHGTVLSAHKFPKYQSVMKATGFFEVFLVKNERTQSFSIWKFKLMELWAYGDCPSKTIGI